MGLKLTHFRIQNYRIIEDTDWISVDDVTALVGINESGKSSILHALYKLNPSIPSPYDALAEFPHDRFHEYESGEGIPVASARFTINDDLRKELQKIHNVYTKPATVECTRYYDGELRTRFEQQVEFENLTPEAVIKYFEFAHNLIKVAKVLEDTVPLPEPPPVNEPEPEPPTDDSPDSEPSTDNKLELPSAKEIIRDYKMRVYEIIESHSEAINRNMDGASLVQLLKNYRKSLDADCADEWQQQMLEPLYPPIDELIAIEQLKNTYKEALEVVKSHLPIFILFEDYATLRGGIYLPEYIQESQKDKPNEWVRTAKALFKIARYPIEDIVKLFNQSYSTSESLRKQGRHELNKQEQEQLERWTRESTIRSESSSLMITREFNKWWSLGDYDIQLKPTTDYFEVRVSDERRDISVELEYRSRGFKYFLSFFLVFEAESDGGHTDSILLLDEPALHLHPNAQTRLLEFFDNVATKNQLIYSTHSPFLIDGTRLDRVRAVRQRKEDGNTIVTDYLSPSRDDDSFLPIQVILGYSVSQTLFMGKRCLIVEGWTDFWTLKMLDKMFADAGKPTLHPDTYVTPTGGTHNVPLTAQMIATQNVPYVILLDSDKSGRDVQRKMIDDLVILTQQCLMVGDVVGQKEADLEALFPVEYFIEATINAYSISPFTESDLPKAKQGGLSESIRRYFEKQGYDKFDKAKVYLWLIRKWSAETLDDLPVSFVENIGKVFEEVNELFDDMLES